MEHLTNAVDNLLEQAVKEELNVRETVIRVLGHEWHGWNKGLEFRLKQARLPWVKTLEQFDFSFQPGVGKTHLAVALGVKQRMWVTVCCSCHWIR